MRAALLLRCVEVGTRLPNLGSAIFHKRELRGTGCLGRIDDRVQADAPRGPRCRRPVIPGRGGHDSTGTVGRIPLEYGQRAAPLERAQLVDVLAFEEELPARERCLLERSWCH